MKYAITPSTISLRTANVNCQENCKKESRETSKVRGVRSQLGGELREGGKEGGFPGTKSKGDRQRKRESK